MYKAIDYTKFYAQNETLENINEQMAMSPSVVDSTKVATKPKPEVAEKPQGPPKDFDPVANKKAAAAKKAPKAKSYLSVGDKGAKVKALQTKLGITADGDFGPKTKAAVVAFQKKKIRSKFVLY